LKGKKVGVKFVMEGGGVMLGMIRKEMSQYWKSEGEKKEKKSSNGF
jgi:hypothetical protein